MTDSEYLRAQILDGFDHVRSLWNDTLPAADWAIEQLPAWVPGFVKSQMHSDWHSTHDDIKDRLLDMQTTYETSGRAYPLGKAAEQWRTYIAGHVSEQPGVISTGKLLADDRFRGMTADAYRSSVIPGQRDAITAVAENLIKPLAQALDDAAAYIDDYGGATIEIIISLGLAVAAFLAGWLAAPTVAGTASLWVAAAGAVGYACYDAYAADHDLSSGMNSAQEHMEGLVAEWTAFENHAWPKAVFQT